MPETGLQFCNLRQYVRVRSELGEKKGRTWKAWGILYRSAQRRGERNSVTTVLDAVPDCCRIVSRRAYNARKCVKIRGGEVV